MKKWIIVLIAAVMGAQPLCAQNKLSWKDIFLGPSLHNTQKNVEEKLKQAVIRQLQANDTTPQKNGQMRAYKLNKNNMIRLQFLAESYIPINYNKENAANCRAILLDNKGTILMNDTCRKALFHTKKQVSFVVDFNNLVPGYKLKISHYPKNTMVFKDNYILAVLPIPGDLSAKLPAVSSPVFVAKEDRWLTEGKLYVLPFSLSGLFNPLKDQQSRKKMAQSLPDNFYAKVEGFY